MMKIHTGTKAFDTLLDGGFENDTITIVYGAGGTGKTNVCLHAALAAAKDKRKAIYIDTEGGFSMDRIHQLEGFTESLLDSIFFLRPTNFDLQKKAFEKLRDMIDQRVGIVIVDTIAMLYRLAIGKSEKVYSLNRELGRQIALLSEISRKHNIPILLTNQVYSAMDGSEKNVMVGGYLLTFQSKCLVELKKAGISYRQAILRKHRSLPEERSVDFMITGGGIEKVDEKKKDEEVAQVHSATNSSRS